MRSRTVVRMRIFRVLGIAMVLLALVAAAAVAWTLRPGRFDGWVETTGTVVALDRHVSRDSDGGQSVTYAMVVEYTDEHGKPFTGISGARSSQPKPVGATVAVRYPPGQPAAATFDDEGTLFGVLFFGIWAVVLGLIGTVFTIVGWKFRHQHLDLGRGSQAWEPTAAHSEDTREPSGPMDPTGTGAGEPPGEWPRLPPHDDR